MNYFWPVMMRFAAVGSLGVIVSVACPEQSRAGPWSLEVAGDWVEDGIVATRTFGSRSRGIGTSGTTGCGINLTRDINRHVSMTGTVTYLSFGEFPYGQAKFVPVAFGIRYSPAAGEGRRGGPYVELGPAVVWSRWKVSFSGIDQETNLRPGLITGLGVHGRVPNGLGVDVGLRYFLSANGVTRYAGLGGRPYSDSLSPQGLRHAGLHFALTHEP